MTVARRYYVISDLHVGGAYADPAAPRRERHRGFRMMTRVAELAGFIRNVARQPDVPRAELVINGDFLDFLAEEAAPVDPNDAPRWKPFRHGKEEALDTFRALAARDHDLFAALRELLRAGKGLTVLLGNHDLELSVPDVRAALLEELGPGRVRFLDDGQALDLGEVLVEHGNVFDPANVVDHDGLRLFRALYSRGWRKDLAKSFRPPAGSRLVAEVMNPIKVDYGFVDLLKPESEPLFSLLLAIEPGYRGKLDELAVSLAEAARTLVPRRGAPWQLRNVSATTTGPTAKLSDVAGGAATSASALDALLADTVPDPAVRASLLGDATGGAAPTEVSGGIRAALGLLSLLLGGDHGDLASRIPQVQATLRALRDDLSFVRTKEEGRYREAAAWLSASGPDTKGYRVVVFGHTHHAKDVDLEETGARYLNTGTWANLMRFPDALTSESATHDEVRAALVAFARRLQNNELSVEFTPTYVQLDLADDGTLLDASVRDYDHAADRL